MYGPSSDYQNHTMPRELRPRKPRPSYAHLADETDDNLNENVAGPSTVQPVDEEGDSESEFGPDKRPGGSKKVPSSDEDEGVAMDDAQAPESEVEETPKQRRKTASSRKPRAPVTGPSGTTDPGSQTVFSTSKTRKEQSRRLPPRVQQATQAPSESTPPVTAPRAAKTYAFKLPNPSAHHRHRAIPVLFREEMVERLDEPPLLFKEPRIVPTNSMTADHSLTNRVSKSWGFNVGAGPVWQIMEDRSCYKESIGSSTGSEKESSRRPRVYQDVAVRPGWEVLINQCVTNSWLRNLYSNRSRTEIAGML